MTGTVSDEMADCFEEAAAMIDAFNDQAETGQRITHQGQIIPQIALALFQAKMHGPVPENGRRRGYQ